MDKQYFIKLLHKYFKGKSTFEERELLISYYNLFQKEPDVVSLLSAEKKEELKNEIYHAIGLNIAESEKAPARIKSLPAWIIRSAAAAVLIAAMLTVVHFVNQKTFPGPNIATQVPVKKQNRLFNLPDGSGVVLSDGSKLNYSADFGKTGTREVYLEGQAYFDIYHDASRPFIVHTDHVMTTVLGTAFNVKAIKNEQDITVTVTRGKVKVSDQNKKQDLLIPDQQIVYDKRKENLVKSKVDAKVYVQWKDQQDLVIDNVTFEETAKLLEDKFGVTIRFKNKELKKNRFTTVLLERETLEQIIKGICDFNGATWEYNKDSTGLMISKKQ